MPTDRVVEQLQDERRRLSDELKRLDQAIDLLTKGRGPMGTAGRSRRSSGDGVSSNRSVAMREAARKRWQPGGDLYEKRKAKQEAEAKQVDAQLEEAKPAKGGRKKK